MRLAIVNLTSGGLSGGYLKYLGSIVPRIESDSRVERVDLFCPPSVDGSRFIERDRAHTWPSNDGRTGFRTLRAKLEELKPDVVFLPSARWIDCGDTPLVVMIRNMEPLTVPCSGNQPLEALRNLARRRVARRSCRESDGVIAVSKYVHEFLRERWHIPDQKLTVVYHGVDPVRKLARLEKPSSLSLPGGSSFIFTAGSIRPARGLEDAIGAIALMQRGGSPIMLAIAGEVDGGAERYHARMLNLAWELGCADRIVWLGPLGWSSMSWAFQNCAAFVMTSRAEACPNTALEAMAHGSICVSTDTRPMPEIFTDAAVYYHGGDAESLSNVLTRALSGVSEQTDSARNRALKRAGDFSWDRTASLTVDFLEARAARRPTVRQSTVSGSIPKEAR